MGIAYNKNTESPRSTQDNITLTREELNDILASFKQEIFDEVREQLLLPISRDIRELRERMKNQADGNNKSLLALEKKMERLCGPQSQANKAAALARLSSGMYDAEEEEDDE